MGEELAGFGHAAPDLLAVLLYDAALSKALRTQVESDLHEKYFGRPCPLD